MANRFRDEIAGFHRIPVSRIEILDDDDAYPPRRSARPALRAPSREDRFIAWFATFVWRVTVGAVAFVIVLAVGVFAVGALLG